jgi:phage repressor protein C with HTH and peptisase S24 domain
LIGQIESINSNTSLLSLYSKDKNKIEAVLKASRDDSVVSKPQTGVGSTSTSTSIDNSSSTLSFSSSTIFNSNNDIRISATSRNIIIDIYGNGSGDFFVSLPDNIRVSTGTIIYLASDESKALGEVVKVENEEASFYQKVFIKGYYNTRINDNYYIIHK